MLPTIKKYASFVKFSHTIFAMPFALIAYVYAITANPDIEFDWLLLIKILLCMVLARNTAMGFNRWADRHIDADNPRTAGREIPAGRISPHHAIIFIVVNAAAFVLVAFFINRLAFYISPLALFIVCGYSFTKRFTALSHIVLGTALAIAPVGAYIAVTGTIAVVPIILAGLVITWVGGFDILYSLQDAEWDRSHDLHSVPARFSAAGAKWISMALHSVSVYAVVILGMYREFNGGILYWTGAAVFTGLLFMQHIIFVPSRIDRIGASFGLVNGLASITLAAFTIADMLCR